MVIVHCLHTIFQGISSEDGLTPNFEKAAAAYGNENGVARNTVGCDHPVM